MIEYKLKLVDLCAGTGAFSLAFESTGKVEVIYANDMCESSKKAYDLNLTHPLTLGDICKLDINQIPAHNILTAGFPCQPFSLAGHKLGFADERSNVFWTIMKIIKKFRPEYVILENVRHLLKHDNGNTFKIVSESIKKARYNMIYKVLNTSTITNIPQHRERIYMVCFKNKKLIKNFNLDFPTQIKDPIYKMLSTEPINDKYYYNNLKLKMDQNIMNFNILKDTMYTYRRGKILKKDLNESPAITVFWTNVPFLKDDKGVRRLTPRECFNFQGFPQTYKLPELIDIKLYKLAGNAVSYPVVKLIADRLMNSIDPSTFYKQVPNK